MAGAGRAGREHQALGAQPTCGDLLRRYRSAAGLTQEELAARAGYSANYIGKLERDQRKLPAASADHLATVLGLDEPDRDRLRAARERDDGELAAPVPPAWPLAGREAELAQIQRLLGGGGPPVLLVTGEPGIGKTRLLAEAVAEAADSGWQIARGGCLRRAQDAFAPLSGALAGALARMPPRERAGALARAGRADLLLPELASPGGDGAPAGVTPERQRRLLVSSAGELLRAVAGPAGTLLVLDDLHWAGPDSVGLLAALLTSQGLPIRVIGAYRDSEATAALNDLIADLAKASLMRVLELAPLTDVEAGRLLTALAPETAQTSAWTAILRRAGGVPFFLVSYGEQVHDGGPDAISLAVPWTVAQVIGQRLAALPAPAWELLSAAAVVGPVVPHALLAEVAGRDEDELLAAVETVLAARLLAEDDQDRYRFPHDLIRDTLEESLSAARRRLLHRRVGQALQRQPDAAAESLAFHFAKAGEDETAARYLELAGDQAQQRVAYAAAAEYYGAAIARLQAVARPGAAVPVAEKHGVALFRAGRHDEAITALEGALAGYRTAGDAEAAARVTGHLALAHYRAGTGRDALGALAGWADADPAEAVASPGGLTRWQGMAWLLHAQGAYAEMVTAGQALARAGHEAGYDEMQAAGRRVEGAGLICLGRLAEGTALMAAVLPAEPAVGAERAVDSAALLASAYLAMGEVSRCEALCERMLAAAERVGDEVTAAMHTALLAGACYMGGDSQRGRDLVGLAQQRFTAGASPMAALAVSVLGSVLIWDGATEQAQAYLEESVVAARSARLIHIERAALAYLAELDLLDGRPDDARVRLHPVIGDRPAPATEGLSWGYAVQLLATLAAAHLDTGDLASAGSYAERAVAEARRMGTWTQGVRALEVQGLILARGGRRDLARAAYQEGLDRAAAMPFPYGQARLLRALALDTNHRSA
ncbi:MAG TPA: AAA family ATPase [Streptosporangiaceae bacterium]|nr:AAA family ATPase [Streptosporangiaceae bacterium]